MSTAEHRGLLGTAPAARLPTPAPLAENWLLDPNIIFLNHGSFGGMPRAVREAQLRHQERLQREPVRFFVELLEPMLDAARHAAARFVGCEPEGFVFVTNATEAVSTVLRSRRFEPGDELLTSAHEYAACTNALSRTAARWGATVVRAPVPFPVRDEDEVFAAVCGAATARTRLALISHVTSPTGFIQPVERIVRELEGRGIDCLVDGAHAPGMLDIGVAGLGAAYYTGNFHKWVCAPPGSAFLHVRADRRADLHPLVISHGYSSARTDRTRLRLEFDYVGSRDPSAWLSVPDAIASMAGLVPGGWPEIRRRNRELALAARGLLCARLGTEPLVPDRMLGSMAAVEVPGRTPAEDAQPTRYHDPLHDRLLERHRVQVPIIPFPAPPARHVRISAQLYNSLEQYEYLAEAIRAETR
ncbi:MAG TPA: aminotransferase class V-fold PLP-dependent enzyme [Phycisphaerales bacterium]|nr:aminotransferase class V-fold PLP-dependent enzyme [Phycisphaerales bacterium]